MVRTRWSLLGAGQPALACISGPLQATPGSTTDCMILELGSSEHVSVDSARFWRKLRSGVLSSVPALTFPKCESRTSLMIKWLRLRASPAGGKGSIPNLQN